MSMLNELSKKTIQSLRSQVECGYHSSTSSVESVKKVVEAIEQGKIQVALIDDQDYPIEQFGDAVEQKEISERISEEGVFTAESQYWTGREWEDCIAIGGFIGDDFVGSGYELQLLEEAMERYNKQDLDADGFVIDPFRVSK